MFEKFDSSNTVCCKNEWLHLSASFTAKSGKVFVLRLENVSSYRFHFKASRKSKVFFKKKLLGIFKIDPRLRYRHVFLSQSVEILNVSIL